MADDKVPDHRAQWREDVLERLVAIIDDAANAGLSFEDLVRSARKRYARMLDEEIIAQFDRE